jgi:uncharacterized protein YunC (DUF1805 family)
MCIQKKIRIGKGYIEAVEIKLGRGTGNRAPTSLILLIGSKGYVMCGYLNLMTARKFKDVAIKIVGVSTIEQSLNTVVHSCSPAARRLGIYKGQPIRDILEIIV